MIHIGTIPRKKLRIRCDVPFVEKGEIVIRWCRTPVEARALCRAKKAKGETKEDKP